MKIKNISILPGYNKEKEKESEKKLIEKIEKEIE